MSSLSKFFENNKLVNSLEKTLTEVLDRIKWTVTTNVANLDFQSKAKELVKIFDEYFTNLEKVSLV